jgi:hypothetical protein
MGFRGSLLLAGSIAIVLSYFVGYWIAWIGIVLVFLSGIFHFADKE